MTRLLHKEGCAFVPFLEATLGHRVATRSGKIEENGLQFRGMTDVRTVNPILKRIQFRIRG